MEFQLQKQHDYLVCIDSDGTVFDSMELKHKECFCPAFINIWHLQNVSLYACEVWNFVNLYSVYRGINRFRAVDIVLRLLEKYPDAVAHGYVCPDLTNLENWIQMTKSLSAVSLEKEIHDSGSSDYALNKALEWTLEVDSNIRHIIRNVPPFPEAVNTIKSISSHADIVVVSVAPHKNLQEEWHNYGIDRFPSLITGQEYGTKVDCIKKSLEKGYTADHVLKIGDAPGDFEAARICQVLFSPVIPGHESESWKRIGKEDFPLLIHGTYKTEMDARLEAFHAELKTIPPWENS